MARCDSCIFQHRRRAGCSLAIGKAADSTHSRAGACNLPRNFTETRFSNGQGTATILPFLPDTQAQRSAKDDYSPPRFLEDGPAFHFGLHRITAYASRGGLW